MNELERLELRLKGAKDRQIAAYVEHDVAVSRLLAAEAELALAVERVRVAKERAAGAS